MNRSHRQSLARRHGIGYQAALQLVAEAAEAGRLPRQLRAAQFGHLAASASWTPAKRPDLPVLHLGARGDGTPIDVRAEQAAYGMLLRGPDHFRHAVLAEMARRWSAAGYACTVIATPALAGAVRPVLASVRELDFRAEAGIDPWAGLDEERLADAICDLAVFDDGYWAGRVGALAQRIADLVVTAHRHHPGLYGAPSLETVAAYLRNRGELAALAAETLRRDSDEAGVARFASLARLDRDDMAIAAVLDTSLSRTLDSPAGRRLTAAQGRPFDPDGAGPTLVTLDTARRDKPAVLIAAALAGSLSQGRPAGKKLVIFDDAAAVPDRPMAALLARARRLEMTVVIGTSSGAWGPSAAHDIAVRVTAVDAAAGVAVRVEREPPLLPGAETGYLAR